MGLIFDVMENSKDFLCTLKELASQPGTEIAVSEKMLLRPLWGKMFWCHFSGKAVGRKYLWNNDLRY